jgi:L-aminopeptidase/D-esterase-like protein
MSMSDNNLITDIRGVRVGNAHDTKVVSGVTSVVFDCDTVASGVTRGGAPGSRDTALLEPEMTIDGVHAVVLSGGSLFGLDAAGGAVARLRAQGRGLQIGAAIVPIVSQAIVFDLNNGGNKDWGRRPVYWDLGWQATDTADEGVFPLGSVGGGFGATTATLKGGLGSASAVTRSGFHVGALAVVNAVGSATIGNGPWFWAAPYERNGEFGGHGWPATMSEGQLDLVTKGGLPPSTTIALVVTDAQLTKPQAKRLALMADDGLARAIRPAHAPMDGDTVFAVATLARPLTDPMGEITEIGNAASDCLARAIARGVYHATIPADGYAGPPAYQALHLTQQT